MANFDSYANELKKEICKLDEQREIQENFITDQMVGGYHQSENFKQIYRAYQTVIIELNQKKALLRKYQSQREKDSPPMNQSLESGPPPKNGYSKPKNGYHQTLKDEFEEIRLEPPLLPPKAKEKKDWLDPRLKPTPLSFSLLPNDQEEGEAWVEDAPEESDGDQVYDQQYVDWIECDDDDGVLIIQTPSIYDELVEAQKRINADDKEFKEKYSSEYSEEQKELIRIWQQNKDNLNDAVIYPQTQCFHSPDVLDNVLAAAVEHRKICVHSEYQI